MKIKEFSVSFLKLLLDQVPASIFTSLIGFFAMILIVVEPDSNLGKSATALLDNISGGYKLLTVFTLILCLFMLLTSIMRTMELIQKAPALISSRISKIGIHGFASFVVPLALLSVSMGIVIFATLQWGSEAKISSLKISRDIAFDLAFVVPFVITILLAFFHWMAELLKQEPSNQNSNTQQLAIAIYFCGASLLLFFAVLFKLLK